MKKLALLLHDSPDLDAPAELDNCTHSVSKDAHEVFVWLADLFGPEFKNVVSVIASIDSVEHEALRRRKPTLVQQVDCWTHWVVQVG